MIFASSEIENIFCKLFVCWKISCEDAFGIIDQTKLPHAFVTLTLHSAEDAAHAIKSMQTRGAPLIGAVLAGGESRRAGFDKARALLGGEP